ncbi:hypothetical protein BC567DRAFT_219903 [Phyllosticta citribraziliensis]
MTRGIVPPTELAIAWQTDLDSYPRGERRGNAVIVLTSVLIFTTLWVLALRLWARLKAHSFGLDDLLIFFAAIPTVGLSISIILGTSLFTLRICPSQEHTGQYVIYGIRRVQVESRSSRTASRETMRFRLGRERRGAYTIPRFWKLEVECSLGVVS